MYYRVHLNETFATCGPADVTPDPKLESRNTYPGNAIWPVFVGILFQLRYVFVVVVICEQVQDMET